MLVMQMAGQKIILCGVYFVSKEGVRTVL